MSYSVEDLKCPNCGFPISIGQKECPAGHPINITSFNSVNTMPAPLVNRYVNFYKKGLADDPENQEINKSIGICFLKLHLYAKALEAFEKAIVDNFDDSESYYYAAVCVLGGKKAFLNPRGNIDKALEYIEAAIMIEPRGIYYYFMAYIKYDYFARKSYMTSPDYRECLNNAVGVGVPEADIQMLYATLNVGRPDCM